MSDLFTFTVEYSEESPHPEKIFSSIAKTIEGMQFLNDELIKCLDLEATNSLTLRSIEKGSINQYEVALSLDSEYSQLINMLYHQINDDLIRMEDVSKFLKGKNSKYSFIKNFF